MSRRKPTESELEILGVLWQRGPSTVAQVKEALDREEETGYTTVLKLLQIMHEKGIVDRDESFRPHVYRARHAEADIQKRLIQDLVRKAFGGSAGRLVVQALSSEKIGAQELSEIRRLIRQAKRKES